MHKTLRLTAISVALASLLLGCAAVGPSYAAPAAANQVPLPVQYRAADKAHHWWQQFNDPVLSQLIEKALLNNQTLAAAEANVKRAYAAFEDSDNAGLPRLDITASQQNNQVPDSATVDAGQIQRQANFGGALSWDLDLFGKLRRAAEAANARAQGAELAWQEAKVQLLAQVAASYGDYRGAELRLTVAEQNLGNLRRTKQIILARRDAGFASDLEISRIDAQMYQLQSTIPQHQFAKAQASATLAALVAQPAEQFVLDSALVKNRPEALPELNKPLSFANQHNYLKFRTDVAVAERELAASTADIGVATAELYPEVSVSGFLGFISSPGLSLGSQNEAWSIAPSLRWQATELSSIQSRIRGAEATQQMAFARFQQTVFDALAQMQSSLQGYRTSREQQLSAQQQVAATEQAVQLTRAQYEAGTTEFLDLLDAEREWLAARDQQAVLSVQSFQRLVSVYRAFAGGLELTESEPLALNQKSAIAANRK
ncbi:efflux transporter outer membrane subunit [Rheinheimera mesophila]|uniref:Efflux transporter outer membrane subunit n=1 Tax=Rheinheimera mesophila TaxID=1547515 RepID=A0A3P3QJ70_9GAMM|nr:efflux transporter outer membrane subunit [Rheinheimera mesophila]KKL01652.1 membrane protein [Rheinheimera mesophila]RRJ21118.1 efflux transporter outer membrane subunit [Rheinheimera mesophila]